MNDVNLWRILEKSMEGREGQGVAFIPAARAWGGLLPQGEQVTMAFRTVGREGAEQNSDSCRSSGAYCASPNHPGGLSPPSQTDCSPAEAQRQRPSLRSTWCSFLTPAAAPASGSQHHLSVPLAGFRLGPGSRLPGEAGKAAVTWSISCLLAPLLASAGPRAIVCGPEALLQPDPHLRRARRAALLHRRGGVCRVPQ